MQLLSLTLVLTSLVSLGSAINEYPTICAQMHYQLTKPALN